jgi:hypothetical protein
MILNLTQHPATPEQRAEGVHDLAGVELAALKEALTFGAIPTAGEIRDRAQMLAQIAAGDSRAVASVRPGQYRAAMIGGAGYLMPALEAALRGYGIEPLHAFARREVVETVGPDGAVTKVAVFRHAGWVRTI